MSKLWMIAVLALGAAGCDDASDSAPALGDCGLAAEACQAATGPDAEADAGPAADAGAEPDAERPVDDAEPPAEDAEPPAEDAEPPAPDATPDAAAPATLTATEPHEAEVEGNWLVAGQPSEARLRELVELGAVIISLRTPGEDPYDEPGLVASLGGTFIRYPTTAADYDRQAFRTGMYDLYDEWRAQPGPVYLHCASANRAGASWALYLGERQGVPGEEAIERGRAAGMGAGFVPLVRRILGLD